MATKYQSHENYTNIIFGIYAARYGAESFTPEAAHTLTSLFIHGYRKGTPGNFHVRVYLANGLHQPTGEIIASGDVSANAWALTPGGWYEIPLSGAPDLVVDTEYVYVCWCDGATSTHSINLRGTSSGNLYTRGYHSYSINAGSSWSLQTLADLAFQEWGEAILDPPTVQTDTPATDIDHEQATLHGTLTADGGEACQVRFNYGKTISYGTNTEWQEGKVTEDTFEQLITGLDPNQLYHFRAEAKNSEGTSYGSDAEFTTSILPPVYGAMKRAQITHPALKTIRIIQHGQEISKFDELSNPDESYIESGLIIHIPTPSTVEVTTLADQTWEFNIPEK